MKIKNSDGFTLLELLIVILIILILAGFAFPVFVSVQERARITQDMNNLRQIGFATQRYLTDNDGVLFSTTSSLSWMKQLHPDPPATQYLAAWNVFQSPWDQRQAAIGDANTPVSYGINGNTNPISVVGMDTSKITNPVAFIFFGAAQDSDPIIVKFQGTAASPTVTVWKDTSNPGGTAAGGTHSRRKQICAVCADGHADNMLWKWFKNDVSNNSDLNGSYRWKPY
jgi:prepilin-type N-terminal cleavage/methylation domain-containing protein